MPIKIQPEPVRRAAMEQYAQLQRLKLKVCLWVGLVAWLAHGCPVPW